MIEPILNTKLFPPRPPRRPVARPRLIARMNEGARRALTLVCAPAGFGKTTLVVAWLESAERLPMPVAWLSLDESDNDPVRFLAYLIAAWQTVIPGLGRSAQAALGESPATRLRMACAILINELAEQPGELALVLDDLHAIGADAVHEALAFLVEQAPPNLHWILTSRVEPPLPLHRLRARDQVVEIRAEDLRFQAEEARAFLSEAMAVDLAPDQVARLEGLTEGWIAGLQLAALSLRGRADTEAVLSAFGGEHRFVLDYLADEVLAGLDAERRDFLLRSSILVRLSGALCDHVLGRDDSQAMLERLHAESLFVFALDAERQWYRYHRLFRDFLQARLAAGEDPAAVAALHRRAADWQAANGLTRRAVDDYLAAGEPGCAADLIVRLADDMWARGRLATLGQWLGALPEPVRAERPALRVLCAWQAVLEGRSFETIEPELAAAEARLAQHPDDDTPEIRARIDTVRAAVASLNGNAGVAIQLTHRALETLPEDEAAWRGANFLNLGLAYASRAAFSAAAEAFAHARGIALRSGDAYAALMASVNLARALAAGGRLHEAERMYRRAMDEMGAGGLRQVPIGGLALVGLGELAREWNALEEAEDCLRRALGSGPGADLHMRVGVAGWLALARTLWCRGDFGTAWDALATAEELARLHDRPEYLDPIDTYRARWALAAGEPGFLAAWMPEAERALAADRVEIEAVAGGSGNGAAPGIRSEAGARAGTAPADSAPIPDRPSGPAARTQATRWDQALVLAECWAAQDPSAHPGRLADARALLDQVAREIEAVGEPRYVIELLVTAALVHARGGDTQAAGAALSHALALAEAEDYVRTFLDGGPVVVEQIRAILDERRRLLGRPELTAEDWAPTHGLRIEGPRQASEAYLRRLLAAAEALGGSGGIPEAVGEGLAAGNGSGGGRAPTAPPSPAAVAEANARLAEPLTERELEILTLAAAGLSNSEIAERLVVAVSTVKTHINHIFAKLGADSRTRAVAEARRLGLV